MVRLLYSIELYSKIKNRMCYLQSYDALFKKKKM